METRDQLLARKVRWRERIRLVTGVVGFIAVAGLVSASAIVVKESRARAGFDALVAVSVEAVPAADMKPVLADEPAIVPAAFVTEIPVSDPLVVEGAEANNADGLPEGAITDPNVRFFNGRMVRKVREIEMTVTAYSPDEQSCGDSADGITSSIHSVWTNAMKLVAADSKVLPLGSMITVPGYDESKVVPVLDRGGAIKGKRLDVLYPTHKEALKWGVQKLKVAVWEYADGKPADDFRAIRDSRN